MPIIDDRTSNLSLALPNVNNALSDDVSRLRSALTVIDTAVAGKQSTLGFTPENAAGRGAANGYASLDSGGKVPSAQLPAYVDDVIEAANLAAFPGTGSAGIIYVALDTNKTYRWSGSAYVEISPSPGTTDSLTEGSVNLYFTNTRAQNAIPAASAGTAGKVKVGSGLSIDGAGVLSATGSGVTNSFTELSITPTANQTVFTPAGGYTVNQIEIYKNGVLLYGAGDDYTATNGTTFTTTSPCQTTDTILLRKWAVLANSGMVQKSGDTLTGALNEAHGTDIASAGTINLTTATGNLVDVTGSTAITAITLADGAERTVRFTGALTLTNGASLVLLGGGNIVTAAGDFAVFRGYAAGVVRLVSYSRAAARQIIPAAAMPMIDKGTVGTGTVTFDASSGGFQRLQVSGALTIAFSNWPATGSVETVMIKMVNWGAATVTLPTINWQLPAGGFTTTFATYLTAIGRSSLQVSGTDFGVFWSDDGGTTLYGKLV